MNKWGVLAMFFTATLGILGLNWEIFLALSLFINYLEDK